MDHFGDDDEHDEVKSGKVVTKIMHTAAKVYRMLPIKNQDVGNEMHFQTSTASTVGACRHKINPDTDCLKLNLICIKNMTCTVASCVG